MPAIIEQNPEVVTLADAYKDAKAEQSRLSRNMNRMSPMRLERELRKAREAFGAVEADAALGAITEAEADEQREQLRSRFQKLREMRELQQQAATLTPEKRADVHDSLKAMRSAVDEALKPLVADLVDALEDVLTAAEAIDEAEANLYEVGAIRPNDRAAMSVGTAAVKATYLQAKINKLTERFDL